MGQRPVNAMDMDQALRDIDHLVNEDWWIKKHSPALVLGTIRLILARLEEPPCRCPAGSYDYPNAVHEPYCARHVA